MLTLAFGAAVVGGSLAIGYVWGRTDGYRSASRKFNKQANRRLEEQGKAGRLRSAMKIRTPS